MKYVILFEKKGMMAYISHLDLQRVFLKILRIAGIRPVYSHGFNPHPKMSIALPLSLGFTSECEYLELETNAKIALGDADKAETTAAALNKLLPSGLAVLGISAKDAKIKKTLSALVRSADYELLAPSFDGLDGKIREFLALGQIETQKMQKKTGKVIVRDIRPSIELFEVMDNAKGDGRPNAFVQLKCRLKAGDASLNPLVMLAAFYSFAGVALDISTVAVKRTSIIFG